MLDEEQGRELARYAREVIAQALGGPPAVPPTGAWCDVPAATFVTLHRGDELHGCIGTLEPRRSLVRDVATNAVAAALRDPRAPFLDSRASPASPSRSRSSPRSSRSSTSRASRPR